MIRVLVARDGGYFGIPVRTLLAGKPDIEVVGTLEFDNNLVDAAIPLGPDVAVIDTEYMVTQVLPVAAEFRARIPDCSLLMLCDPSKRGMLPPRRRTGGNVPASPRARRAGSNAAASPQLRSRPLPVPPGCCRRASLTVHPIENCHEQVFTMLHHILKWNASVFDVGFIHVCGNGGYVADLLR